MNFSELLREYKISYLDDEQLNQVREERLALMLASEIEENEPLWTDYEFEETQIKMDLTELILEHLFEETATLVQNKGALSSITSVPQRPSSSKAKENTSYRLESENSDKVEIITDED